MAKKARPKGPKNLTPKNLDPTIPDVRQIVVGRMREMKMTPYALAKKAREGGGKLSEQTVRNYLDGTHDIASTRLAALLAALGMEIRRK